MANRKRTIKINLYVSEEEDALIKEKMDQCNARNFSEYARKMLIDGYIIHQEYETLSQLVKELAYINRNLNQIARRCNETRSIYEQDVKDLQTMMKQVKTAVSERLVKMAKAGM